MNNGSNRIHLGINGFGRIGKLALWHHVARNDFTDITINIGRQAGTRLEDIAHYLQRDSTYGALHTFLHGCHAQPVVEALNEADGSMRVNGVTVRFLRNQRNPAAIDWRTHNVRLVVDTTGRFLDPTLPADHDKGALRGHLAAGAERVIASAPFKIKAKATPMPEDAVTTVMGINESQYDPRRHRLISNASCTTTCLAHMIKPLLDAYGAQRILSASMATVHAATGSQQVLDRLPQAGKTDLRKNRSIMNNIILTTTGAAAALALVIPEMKSIGFIAESVRIPTSTGSLIILVLSIQENPDGRAVTREAVNAVYARTAADDPHGYLHFSQQQNVSVDIIGTPRAAAIIEGHETHTRTAELAIDLKKVPGIPADVLDAMPDTYVRPQVTQAVVYGWYDNEMGSYVHMLGDRTISVAEQM
ncbi:MAG: glyceraldehyde-3-phosphate dehydrogenase [Desulfatitalea sp.]|nr:glyceraldehyde-3-phosphate dehydrogenase [Desulfatitalea sp.]NNK00140.1 glyceraldehyde-3-phosphate dehydrogenase [Desulfatitalea sp.]